MEQEKEKKWFRCFWFKSLSIDLLKAWDLDQPSDVVRIDVAIDGPFGQFEPFVTGFPVDRNTQFCILIFGFFEISGHFLPGEKTQNLYCERPEGCLFILTLIISAKYFPFKKLSVLRKTSRNRDSPIGLYFALNLSNRWNVFRSCEIPNSNYYFLWSQRRRVVDTTYRMHIQHVHR